MSEPPIADPQLLAAYRKVLADHGGTKEVTGVDVGFLYVDGKRTDEQGVRVHFGGVPPRRWSIAAKALPAEIDDVRVSPMRATYRLHGSGMPDPLLSGLQSGFLPLDPGPTTRLDPIQPGVSVSHHMLQGGTLGLIVYDRHSGAQCILSNWHVLADRPDARPGDPVVQPGAKHNGRDPAHTIATLHRFLLDDDGDAAIAELNGKRDVHPAQWESQVRIEAVRMPRIGEIVSKSGVRTAVTSGLVDGCGRYFLRRPVGNEVVVGMDGFRIVPVLDGNPQKLDICGPGDSGAAWYGHDDHLGVGLHVAGTSSSDSTKEDGIACYLPRVLDRLEVSLAPPASPFRSFLAPPVGDELARADDTQALLVESVARLARLVERLLSERGA